MAKKERCFIIMPITTPKEFVADYRGDDEHFRHVLEHLFVPAVEKAGLEAVRPIAEGADVIHAEIIKNIDACEVVLCDMSRLNPNVFFELGVRTALNKPVCLIRDERTPHVPFDTSIVNHHRYRSGLEPWTLESEIANLADHIKKSIERSQGRNPLWHQFALKKTADLPVESSPAEARLDLLSTKLDGLEQLLSRTSTRFTAPGELEIMEVFDFAHSRGIEIPSHVTIIGRTVYIPDGYELPIDHRVALSTWINLRGYEVSFS
ncbi:MAG: nucleoside 2-deoxyribosyltransferase [Planctomycetota bacterium]